MNSKSAFHAYQRYANASPSSISVVLSIFISVIAFESPALADPADVFFETVNGQLNRQAGIYFQSYKSIPALNAPAVDAKDLVVVRGTDKLRLNVQRDYNGVDFAACKTAPGTKGSWQNDASGQSILSWHESMYCQGVKVGSSVQDLIVMLNLDGSTGEIEITSKTSSLHVYMDLRRK